ncbi:MAG: response regulator [Clostridiales bacterium]|nr:response regulator [Clostridiales bacterium]
MSTQFQLFRHIAEETADGIYVIRKGTYEILYENESKLVFSQGDQTGRERIGRKCYEALHGRKEPCPFCMLDKFKKEEKKSMGPTVFEGYGRFYNTYFREYEWNGEPAYISFVRDVTEDVKVQKEKERLEQYFQTVLKHLPGGAAVVRHSKDGKMTPEFLSDGFAEMVNMSPEEVWELYQKDALAGVHPEDRERLSEQLNKCISERKEHYEIVYRLQKGEDDYLWVKASFSLILSEGGDTRVYVDYHDITKEREDARMLRQQYQEQLLQHYLTPGPNVMVLGHCNITANRIAEIDDHTNSDLLQTFGDVREEFFQGISTLVVDSKEREDFLNSFLNMPSLVSFNQGETEIKRIYFIRLPKEKTGRYAQFKVNLVEAPDTGDITGILTVTDVTNQVIHDQILHQISINSCDLIADVDLFSDTYAMMNCVSGDDTPARGSHSQRLSRLMKNQVIPREREHVARMLDPDYMLKRLKKDDIYTFSYSIVDAEGEIRAKKLVVSAIDLRLGRVCLARTDITDSVREQRGLLNMIAYTFELACFVELDSNVLTMYTRKTVLKNLPPYTLSNYDSRVEDLSKGFGEGHDHEEIEVYFTVENMLKRLEQAPSGYDFVLPYKGEDGIHYKQINVLWGDENRKTICLVRADITDVIETERRSKEALEEALVLAEKANRAKSEFLSSMSHDIRTPMNAIIGMTTLGLANLGDQAKVENYLKKIAFSSKHLLSLINDILDMSKIERGGISLNCAHLSLEEMIEQLSSMMEPQAREAGIIFHCEMNNLQHTTCYGDGLRINQILINLVGNALKFTPEGGSVLFRMEEISPHKEQGWNRYRFTIQDTGIGMTQEFIKHLFEPFTRSSSVTGVEGTGLGLSITKGLIDLMEGTIQIESCPGKGTTFVVELEIEMSYPEMDMKIQTCACGQTKTELLEGRHFLVAEDNAINSEILCELLGMRGASAVVKENGLLAVREFEREQPGTYDAILMDIQMPVMNGFEAAKAVRELPRPDAALIPIVAMTANAFAEDVQAALDAGMNEHVAKPVDMEVLCEALQKVLKK